MTDTDTDTTDQQLAEAVAQLQDDVAQLRGQVTGGLLMLGKLHQALEATGIRAMGVRAQLVHLAGRPDVQLAAAVGALLVIRGLDR